MEVAVDENLLSVEGKIQKLFSEMSFSKRSKKKFSFSLMDCISSSNEKIVVSFETFKKCFLFFCSFLFLIFLELLNA